MKYLESRGCSVIMMEKGDCSLHPNKVKGLHVNYIFIPECDTECYTKDNPLYLQLLANISIAGIYFGQLLTYKPYENNIQ